MPRYVIPNRPLTGIPYGLPCSAGCAEDGPGARLSAAQRRGCQWEEITTEGKI